MELRPGSVEYLTSSFNNTASNTPENSTTLSITTSIYNDGDYKAGRAPVGTFTWSYVANGVFTCTIPANALGPGPNEQGNVWPLTVVTIGIDATDGVTQKFKDVVVAFPKPTTS